MRRSVIYLTLLVLALSASACAQKHKPQLYCDWWVGDVNDGPPRCMDQKIDIR